VSAGACASAQFCDHGFFQPACDKVLVVHTYEPYAPDVQSTLMSTGAFATVDTFDATSATPSAAQLGGYHAVLAYSGIGNFADTSLLGDRLADFHDQGGGVVVTHLASSACCGNNLQGAYGAVSRGYALMDYTQGNGIHPTDSLGDVLEEQSPLMRGVTSFSMLFADRSTAPVVAGRGVVVARWRNGDPLVLRGTRGNRTLVELNFFPPSSSVDSRYWIGDGAALLRNGLKYSRCMACGAGTYAGAGIGWEGGGRRV
jgi:hypothetical protein